MQWRRRAVAGLKDVTGVLVQPYTEDNANSPAKRAGIEPGDVIVKADGKLAPGRAPPAHHPQP
jgi:S1-C subfamily serine protease